MADRILDLSQSPAYLHVRNRQLVIERDDHPPDSIPLDDLAAVVVSHPRVRFSQSVLAGLAECGGTFIVCDAKHMPVGMLMPLQSHHVQGERFAVQAGIKRPVKKRLWQQIIRAKIRTQGALLTELTGDDAGLDGLISAVHSGDPHNVEAQAARRYWPALFGSEFRRDHGRQDHNRMLNYGYAVLRGAVARAICAAGLHPALGLHHHNRYDAFCLADDLIEPFRTIVDRAVYHWIQSHDPKAPLDKNAKIPLLSALTARYNIDGERRTLFDVMTRVANSLVAVFDGRRKSLTLPKPHDICRQLQDTGGTE